MALTSPEHEPAAFKPAEDGNGYIMRVVDRYGRGGQGALCRLGREFPVNLALFAIATFRLALAAATGPLCPVTC